MVKAADIPIGIKSFLSLKRYKILGVRRKSPLVMGVLNTSPDSFSNGSNFSKSHDVLKYLEKMVNDGIDIIDIGGESTKPGFETISPDLEINRIAEVLKVLRKDHPNLVVSVDTRKSQVAEYAFSRGVKIFNDVSSFNYDRDSFKVAKKFGAYVCLMHNSGAGKDLHKKILGKDFLLDIFDHLRERIQFAELNGISRTKIAIDPGIGFGKTVDQNITIIANISLFHTLGCPIVVGVSRKGFVGRITGEDQPANRMLGSVLLATELIKQGVQVVRVHDIKETNQAINMCYKMNLAD